MRFFIEIAGKKGVLTRDRRNCPRKRRPQAAGASILAWPLARTTLARRCFTSARATPEGGAELVATAPEIRPAVC